MQPGCGGLDLMCPEHKEKIISAQMSETGESKLFCLKCFTGQQLSIEQLSQQLSNLRDNKIRRLTAQKQKSEKRLRQLIKIYTMIKDKFNYSINQILQMIDDGQNNLILQINKQMEPFTKSIEQISLTQVEQHLKELKKEDQIVDIDLYQDIDEKLREKTVEQYIQLLRELQDQLNQLELKWKATVSVPEANMSQPDSHQIIQQQQEIVMPSVIPGQFKLIQEEVETSHCWAMAMDKDEKILVNGEGYDIQLWVYDNGSLTLKQTLKGHTNFVNCLCFSKKKNWLISGSDDKILRIWKEQDNGEWISFQILEGHQNKVYNVVLNDDEDQFISCSYDYTIKVWMKQIDDGTKWECSQTLTEHTSAVYHLSFNPDCSILASCGQDRLRIWKKGIDKIWQQKQVVDEPKNDPYIRVCFISANELIATTKMQGRFYRLTANDNGLFRVSQELVLNEIEESLSSYFPILYNKELRLAICRHSNDYMYILIQQSNDEFKIHQVLSNKYPTRYLTKNGRQLILQNDKTDKIEMWELKMNG